MTYYAIVIALATRHARTCRRRRRRRLLCATRIDRLYRDDEYDVYDDVYDDACDDDDDGGCREHRGNRTHHFDDAKSAR